MTLLTRNESEVWLRERCPEALAANQEPTTGEFCYVLPKDGGVRIALARSIATRFFSGKAGLLYVPLTGVWQSSEMPSLFEGVRSLRSEIACVDDKPGTLFQPDETQDLAGLIALSLIFCWDVILVTENSDLLFTFSHDEYLCARALEADHEADLTAFLDAWKFPRIQ